MNQKTPIFNAPIAVKWIAGITLIAHLLRIYMLTTEDSLSTLIDMAFIPSRYKEVEVISITQLTSPLTYVFVHGDFTHLLINVFLFLAFGTAVGRRMGPQPLVVLYISSGLAGAFTFWLLNIGLVVPMIGASGAVSGMVGAVCRLSFRQSDPERPMPFHARKSAISFVVFWLIFNFIFGMLPPEFFGTSDTHIAWEAHLGGFLFGFFAIYWFDGRGNSIQNF